MITLCRPQALRPVGQLEAITRAAATRIATLEATADADVVWLVDQAIELLDRVMPGRRYRDLPPELFELATDNEPFLKLLTARLLAGVSTRRMTRPMPDAILPEL